MAFKGLDRMKKAMDKVQDLQDKDPNEMAAEKLNKEIQEVQAKQKKEFDMLKKNIPLNDDMGPFPTGTRAKGLEFVNPKDNEQVRKSQEAARTQMLKNIKESRSGPEVSGEYRKKGGAIKVKKMAKGGSVSSASKRADGCATKGKTKGRII